MTKTLISLRTAAVIFLFFLQLLYSCSNSTKTQHNELPPPNDDFFQELSHEAGLNFTHTIGDMDLDNIIESVGGGVAFIDYDQDGFIDVFFCNGRWIEGFSKGEKSETPFGNRLYRNLHDGTFEDVTKKAGVEGKGYGMGVSVGDYNNDGFPDLFISNYGPNELFRNN